MTELKNSNLITRGVEMMKDMVDLSLLLPGDELYWTGGLDNPRRQLVKGDLTRALETWRREWQIPEDPDRISINKINAFLVNEAEGIPVRLAGAASWGIYLRYRSKPVPVVSSDDVGLSPVELTPVTTVPQPTFTPPVMVACSKSQCTPEGVSKMPRPHHTRKGRPRLTVPRQLSLADQQGLSLRKRGVLLGISAATVLRRDREKIAANTVAREN
jgi:hypothetical protein